MIIMSGDVTSQYLKDQFHEEIHPKMAGTSLKASQILTKLRCLDPASVLCDLQF